MGKNSGVMIEGIGTFVDCTIDKTLQQVLEELWDGIRSGISYSGYKSVDEFIGKGVFEVKGI